MRCPETTLCCTGHVFGPYSGTQSLRNYWKNCQLHVGRGKTVASTIIYVVVLVVVVVVVVAWWLFPRVRGFWENVRQFILCLRIFFLKWRLARAN